MANRFFLSSLSAAILVSSCKQQDPPPANAETVDRTTASPRLESLSISREEAVAARLSELNRLHESDIAESIRLGLLTDEERELSALSDWQGEIDLETTQYVLQAHFSEMDPEEALARYMLIKANPALAVPVLATIMEKLADKQPDKAIAWLRKNNEDKGALGAAHAIGVALGGKDNQQEIFARFWQEDDPAAIKAGLLDGLISNWVTLDFEGPFNHLSTLEPSPELDHLTYRLIGYGVEVNAADTMPWAESIKHPGLRRSAILETAQIWQSRDPESYEAWKTDAPTDLREELP